MIIGLCANFWLSFLLDGCFFPWILFPSWIFGESDLCGSAVVLTGYSCWCCSLGFLDKLGKGRWNGNLCVIHWGWGREEEEAGGGRSRSSARELEMELWSLEKRRERLRSVVSLPSPPALVACGFPGNTCWCSWLGWWNRWGKWRLEEKVCLYDPLEIGAERKGRLKQVVCYWAEDEPTGLNLEKKRKRWRSAVSLFISLAGVVCRLSRNNLLDLEVGIKQWDR